MQQAKEGCNVCTIYWTDLFEEIETEVRSTGQFSTEPEIKQEASKRFTLNVFVPDVRSIVKERSGAKEIPAEKDYTITDQGIMVATNDGLVSAEDLFINRRQKKNIEDIEESETLRAAFVSIISSPTAEVYFPVHNKTDGVDQVRYVSHWKREGNTVKAKMIRIDEAGTDKSMREAHTIISGMVGDGFTETRRSERHYLFSKTQHPAVSEDRHFPVGIDRGEIDGRIAPFPPVEVTGPSIEPRMSEEKAATNLQHHEPEVLPFRPLSNGEHKLVVPHSTYTLIDDVTDTGRRVIEDFRETVADVSHNVRKLKENPPEVPLHPEPVGSEHKRYTESDHYASGDDHRRVRVQETVMDAGVTNDANVNPNPRTANPESDQAVLEKTWQAARNKQTVITFARDTGVGVGAALANIRDLANLPSPPVRRAGNIQRTERKPETKHEMKTAIRRYRRSEAVLITKQEKKPEKQKIRKAERVTKRRLTLRPQEREQIQSAIKTKKTEIKAYPVRMKKEKRSVRRVNRETQKRVVQRKERRTVLHERIIRPVTVERKRRRIRKSTQMLTPRSEATKEISRRERPVRRLRKEKRKRRIMVSRKRDVFIVHKNYPGASRMAEQHNTTIRKRELMRLYLKTDKRHRMIKNTRSRKEIRTLVRVEPKALSEIFRREVARLGLLAIVARERRVITRADTPVSVRIDTQDVEVKSRNGFRVHHAAAAGDGETRTNIFKEIRAVISFRFALVLWYVLRLSMQIPSNVENARKELQRSKRTPPVKDLQSDDIGSPWVLLAIISYLAALREQGVAPMYGFSVPAAQMPRSGTIFLYQSWYD